MKTEDPAPYRIMVALDDGPSPHPYHGLLVPVRYPTRISRESMYMCRIEKTIPCFRNSPHLYIDPIEIANFPYLGPHSASHAFNLPE